MNFHTYLNSWDNICFHVLSNQKRWARSTLTLVRLSYANSQYNKKFEMRWVHANGASSFADDTVTSAWARLLTLLLALSVSSWEHTTGCEASDDEDSVPEYSSASESGCCRGYSVKASFGLLSSSTKTCLCSRDFACWHSYCLWCVMFPCIQWETNKQCQVVVNQINLSSGKQKSSNKV